MTTYKVDICGNYNDLHVFQNSSGATVSENAVLSDGQSANLVAMQNNINELDSSVNILENSLNLLNANINSLDIDSVGFEEYADSYLQDLVKPLGSVGKITSNYAPCVTVHARKGNYIYNKAFGIMDPCANTQVDISTNTKFSIRSIGKVVTSMLVEKFVELKIINSIDDPLVNYIPQFGKVFDLSNSATPDISLVDGSSITIADCMKEENGFGYFNPPSGYVDPDGNNYDICANNTLDWVLLNIEHGSLRAAPGYGSYGGGATTLGAICEIAYALHNNPELNASDISVITYYSDISLNFKELLNNYLFAPCGGNVDFLLKDQSANVLSIIPNLVTFNELNVVTPVSYVLQGLTNAMEGGNGMVTTSEDLGKLFHMIMNKGVAANGTRVLRSKTADKILNYNINENNNKLGPFSFDSLNPNHVTFAHGIVKVFTAHPGIFTAPEYLNGVRFWGGLWGSKYVLYTNDDAQIVINQAVKNGTSNRDSFIDFCDKFVDYFLK